MAKQIKKEPVQDIIEEITEEIDEIIEEPAPKKIAPMVTKRFENKIDLSPVVEGLNKLSDKLDQVLKPKEELKTDPILPIEQPKSEPRKYRLFDEFDPTIGA